MSNLKQYIIPFIGLKQGKHLFEYEIDNTFFDAYGFNEFNYSSLQVTLVFEKKTTFFELNFEVTGTVNVDCDTSLEPFNQKINGNLPLVIKFGQEYNDDNDEMIIIPHEYYELDVSQFIYELIILSLPTKKVHPKVLDGTMDSEALNKLRELEIKKNKSSSNEDITDPRWDKLKSLITEKKT
ncbi:DUF177 domain-containing protein [Flavobacteriaceae bacterium]|nr:DUF177 domain-containing protein [Flavobacteriaceae bacterium]